MILEWRSEIISKAKFYIIKKGNDDSDHKFLIESFINKIGFENNFLFKHRKRILFSLIMLAEHDAPMNHKTSNDGSKCEM